MGRGYYGGVAGSDVYAVLTIRTNKDLPVDLGTALGGRFTAATDTRGVIDATVYEGNYSQENDIVFSSIDRYRVFFVEKPEEDMLKIHFEKSLKKDDLKDLKQRIEQFIESLEDFLKDHSNGTSKLEIEIWSNESDSIQTGKKVSLKRRFWESLREEFVAKLLVPFAVFAATYLLSPDSQRIAFALFYALVAVITVLVLVVAATFSKPSIVYE